MVVRPEEEIMAYLLDVEVMDRAEREDVIN
jgi:hypothetical protein